MPPNSHRTGRRAASSNRRASKACNECSRKKIKCDLNRPRCSNCIHAELKCVYVERRKPGPAKGTIRPDNRISLLQRINDLEVLLSQNPPVTQRNNPNPSPIMPSPDFTPLVDLDSDDSPLDTSGLFTEYEDLLRSHEIFLPESNGRKQDDGLYTWSAESAVPWDAIDLTPFLSQPTCPRPIQGDFESAHRKYLVNLYMATADQYFPLFPTILDHHSLVSGTENNSDQTLVDAICAVASNFPDDSSPLNNLDGDAIGRRFFERARSAHLDNTTSSSYSVNLATIKTSLLLTIYECTRLPSPTAWISAGQTIRLAYEFGLDRVDDALQQNLSPREAEDRRCLWWSLWFLDTFISAIFSRPYAIDSTCMQSNVPSTSYKDIVSGYLSPPSRVALQQDLTQAWRDIADLNVRFAADSQRLYLILLSFQREVCSLRRVSLSDHSGQHRLGQIRQSLAAVHLALPGKLTGRLLTEENCMELEGERIRIETALLLHQISLILNLPSANNITTASAASVPPDRWINCVDAAITIAQLVGDIPPKIIAKLNPTTSSTFYLAAVVIIINEKTTEQSAFKVEIEALLAALGRAGSRWQIARNFHRSLEFLLSSLAISKQVSAMDVLKDWRGPFLPSPFLDPVRSTGELLTNDRITDNKCGDFLSVDCF